MNETVKNLKKETLNKFERAKKGFLNVVKKPYVKYPACFIAGGLFGANFGKLKNSIGNKFSNTSSEEEAELAVDEVEEITSEDAD